MSEWIKASVVDLKDEPVAKNRGHSFVNLCKNSGFPTYCRYCGHVPLKNDISRYISKFGCGYKTDGRYLRWRKTWTI